MKDRIAFILYVVAVILITLIHDIRFLLVGMSLLILISGRDFWKIAKKAAYAIVMFNSIVTISYVFLAKLEGDFSSHYVALVNVRVFALTYLTFLMRERINMFKALEPSRPMLYALNLAYSQVLTLKRLFEEFRAALRSRSIDRLSVRTLYRHGASMGAFFLHKSLNDTREITQAMKSRGFFND
ncbi:MAG: hypothetical protein ACE5OP_10150 [Candidatus Glassbacteria bacterium]